MKDVRGIIYSTSTSTADSQANKLVLALDRELNMATNSTKARSVYAFKKITRGFIESFFGRTTQFYDGRPEDAHKIILDIEKETIIVDASKEGNATRDIKHSSFGRIILAKEEPSNTNDLKIGHTVIYLFADGIKYIANNFAGLQTGVIEAEDEFDENRLTEYDLKAINSITKKDIKVLPSRNWEIIRKIFEEDDYFNCVPITEKVHVEIEGKREKKWHARFYAIRDINPGQKLLVDYRYLTGHEQKQTLDDKKFPVQLYPKQTFFVPDAKQKVTAEPAAPRSLTHKK